ncbi:acetolactate decarboxylase [Candidatus Magnetominusculus xianensis]|uniref:Alpha-acetolactate decarboxylase n=1 Tax=Candidatus Magnetominusculus xianensis TaxID=1748249 RepID=A0ABR5SIE3_9BACT|nr:acetolactate decarboxylase [Candidatus Magnetominusculus xianensis]KWT91088.1 alpha-acetolactate decarboxylase [Candidatus Magnetominusculus xianensis]MBF0403267.1 acetolactate decarboxylase [Nitrospirota bacterium]
MYYILALIITVLLTACTQPHVLYQYSSLNALMEGVYDGQLTIGELKRHGDLGLGTFNGLDGEMIVVDGIVYQIKGDGTVFVVNDNVETPFAAVVFFKPAKSFSVEQEISCEELQKRILQLVPSPNIFYAVKIEGLFKHIRARAVKAQNKPYPRLIEAAKGQGMFDFKDIRGTLAGFYFPETFGGLSVGGFHVHFLSDDRKSGGHLMSCQVSRAAVDIDYLTDFSLELPKSGGTYGKSIGTAQKQEVDLIEKGR